MKGSESVGFAFELLATQTCFYIVIDTLKHVWHVVVTSDGQVCSLGPLVVTK